MAPKTIRRVARSSDQRVTSEPRTIREYGINFGSVLLQSGGYSYGSNSMITAVRLKVEQIQLVSGAEWVCLGESGLQGA